MYMISYIIVHDHSPRQYFPKGSLHARHWPRLVIGLAFGTGSRGAQNVSSALLKLPVNLAVEVYWFHQCGPIKFVEQA